MKNSLRRWKKDKKRKEELLKSKHIQSQQRNEISETDKTLGKNHLFIMFGMVILVLGFILYRMQ